MEQCLWKMIVNKANEPQIM